MWLIGLLHQTFHGLKLQFVQHIDYKVFTFGYETNFGMKIVGKKQVCIIVMPLLCWDFILFSIVARSSSSTQEKWNKAAF